MADDEKTGPRSRLRALEDKMWRPLTARLRLMSAWQRAAGAGALIGSFLAGWGGGMEGPLRGTATLFTNKGTLIFGGGLLGLICGIFVLLCQDSFTAALIVARDLSRDASQFLTERDELKKAYLSLGEVAAGFDNKRFNRLQAFEKMVGVIELALAARDNAESAAVAMLAKAKEDILQSLDYRAEDYLSIAIFRRVDRGDGVSTMRRIAWAPTNQYKAGLQPPRDWNYGEGYTGVAWQIAATNKEGIVEPNTMLPQVKGRYPVKDAVPARELLYKSVAAIPILLGGRDEVWGVVTATSDRFDVFGFETDLQKQSVGVIGDIASIGALLARCDVSPRA